MPFLGGATIPLESVDLSRSGLMRFSGHQNAILRPSTKPSFFESHITTGAVQNWLHQRNLALIDD
jgi:hypothetical protein